MSEFFVNRWEAWAPGLPDQSAWLAWCQNTAHAKEGAPAAPPLSGIAPLLKRRLDFSGKMTIEVAKNLLGDIRGIPVIFASRHGEVARSVAMLKGLAAGEPVSPTAFSLSVHNAVAGLFSIIRKENANLVTLSARKNLAASALAEAAALLATGSTQVAVVLSNTAPPECFGPYADRRELPFAYALLLCKTGATRFSLDVALPDSQPDPTELPEELAVLRFLIDPAENTLTTGYGFSHWQWRRHAG